MDEKRFLGSGMKFPPQVDAGTGRFALSSDTQSVKESVYIILMTHRGERWLEPTFGSKIMNYTFMDTSLTMLTMLRDELRSLILEQEPRISSVDVKINNKVSNGCLIINIGYVVAETSTRDNLVFPFYLNNYEDPEEETEGVVINE